MTDYDIEFPNDESKLLLDSLVGIDDKKIRMEKGLRMILHPESLQKWSQSYHQKTLSSLDYVTKRPSLFLLCGDVGVGKTALAQNIGDAVARSEKISIFLFQLSLASRGSGLVGEMTKLVTNAFETLKKTAEQFHSSNKSRGGCILLIDEADALVQSREYSQMHHEDRAGVNAVIRGIDEISSKSLPAAVIMCTNRLPAIDPAVQRRAVDILTFSRPNEKQRHMILSQAFKDVFSEKEIKQLVNLTGNKSKDDIGFTFSDLTQRLIPNVVMTAYPDSEITYKTVEKVLEDLKPTPVFNDSIGK